jgi:hypothetical protein
VAKQTGPQHGVKVACAALLALAGCSQDHWYNSHKSPAEMAADTKTCNSLAEENTLQRRGSDRANYGDTQRMPQPRNTLPMGNQTANLGESPMQLHDRVSTEKSFDREFAQCMRDKGYSLEKPAGS